MQDEFRGKTVLITGASRGIGAAIADYFTEAGANVVGVARTAANTAGFSLFIQSDVMDYRYILDTLREHNIVVDILINNAGIVHRNPILEESDQDVRSIFDTNFFAPLFLSREIAKDMIAHQVKGSILHALSFATVVPSVNSASYAASKSALAAMTKLMAAEFAPYGIRVNGYSPGVIYTEMTKDKISKKKETLVEAIALKKIGTPKDVVDAVSFLASEKSAYITGINLEITGGKLIVQNSDDAWSVK